MAYSVNSSVEKDHRETDSEKKEEFRPKSTASMVKYISSHGGWFKSKQQSGYLILFFILFFLIEQYQFTNSSS